MSRETDIRDREIEIKIYHEARMRREGLTSGTIIDALPMEERIDWSALTSAKVEYLDPIGDEDPDTLAETYLGTLTKYIETWVDPYNAKWASRRWWNRIYFKWINFGTSSSPGSASPRSSAQAPPEQPENHSFDYPAPEQLSERFSGSTPSYEQFMV